MKNLVDIWKRKEEISEKIQAEIREAETRRKNHLQEALAEEVLRKQRLEQTKLLEKELKKHHFQSSSTLPAEYNQLKQMFFSSHSESIETFMNRMY